MSSFRTFTSLVLFLFVIPSFSSSLSFIIGLIVSTTAVKHWGAAEISSEIAVCYFVWSPWRPGARFYSCLVNVLRNYFFACIVPNRVFCRGHFLLSRADRAANWTFYTSCRHSEYVASVWSVVVSNYNYNYSYDYNYIRMRTGYASNMSPQKRCKISKNSPNPVS